MSLNNWKTKLSICPTPQVRSVCDFGVPSRMEYDEVIFDPRTNRYLTLSQEREIERLKKELEEKEEIRNEGIKNIIGYFYKRRP